MQGARLGRLSREEASKQISPFISNNPMLELASTGRKWAAEKLNYDKDHGGASLQLKNARRADGSSGAIVDNSCWGLLRGRRVADLALTGLFGPATNFNLLGNGPACFRWRLTSPDRRASRGVSRSASSVGVLRAASVLRAVFLGQISSSGVSRSECFGSHDGMG